MATVRGRTKHEAESPDEGLVLVGPDGPYVANTHLWIGNTRGEPHVAIAPGEVVTFEEGDTADPASLIRVGALLVPKAKRGQALDDETLNAAIAEATAEAEATEAQRVKERKESGRKTFGAPG